MVAKQVIEAAIIFDCKVIIIIAAGNFSHILPIIAFREFTWFEKPTHWILYSADLDSQAALSIHSCF